MEKSFNSTNDSQNLNQDINYFELFENAKKCLQNEDIKNAFYFLNLVMNCEEIENDLNTKFLCFMFLNQLNFKQKNFSYCINNSKKILKYIQSKKYKLLSFEIQCLFINSLYSTSKILDENGYCLLAYLLLNKGKFFLDELIIDSEDKVYHLIMKGLSSNILKLQEYVIYFLLILGSKCKETCN